MSFTDKIKAEILSKQIKETHCKKAFIAGLIRGSGVLYEKDGELGVEFKAPDEQTAMTLTTAFSQLYDYEIREVSVKEDKQFLRTDAIKTISRKRFLFLLIVYC